MQPIMYDVAVSLDGFIAGPGEDVSLFAQDGKVVEDYAKRLEGYATAIMGRSTYEFGFRYGLQPGQNPYPNMTTIVFSKTLTLPKDAAVATASVADPAALERLKASSDGPIYLCGGGAFASTILALGLIDRIILKRAPCLYGSGTPLFGTEVRPKAIQRVTVKEYDNGYLLEEFIPTR